MGWQDPKLLVKHYIHVISPGIRNYNIAQIPDGQTCAPSGQIWAPSARRD